MSCNGCRVLRKGCSNDCVIRPCLEWIKSPESQANATIFLAKFYGRVGLVNLINTAPHHLRPAIFRSLLYEACGRIVNPIHGSVGLLWTGNWRECQSAVDSVLKAGSATFSIKNTALDSTKPSFPADIEPYGHVIGHQLDMIAGENDVKPYGSCFKRRRAGRGLKYEDNCIVSSSTSGLHRSSGGVNGAVKLDLTLGDGYGFSPVADDDQAGQK